MESILLRFRDLVADTIAEHNYIIKKKGFVWWGWWKKEDEPDNTVAIKEIDKIFIA